MISEQALEQLSHDGPRVVSNALPGPKSRAIIDRLDALEFSNGMSRGSPLAYAGGKGTIFEDADGNRFVDLWPGRTCTYVGISHPHVVAAIQAQAAQLSVSGDVQGEVRARLVETFSAMLPEKMREDARVILTLSGSQANEIAVRIAMRATGRRTIVAFSNCFHGIWGLAWEFTSLARLHGYDWGNRSQPVSFQPYPDCFSCPLGLKRESCGLACADLLERALAGPNSGVDDVACVIVEAEQNNGHIPLPEGWLQRLREICDRIGALLVVDEIANGFLLTGDVWAHERHGVRADIVTAGKGLGGAFPFAAIALTGEVAERAKGIAAYNGQNANPVVLTAAQATLDVVLDAGDDLLGRAKQLATDVAERLAPLKRLPVVAEIRTAGMTAAIELVRDKASGAPVADGRQPGTPLYRMLAEGTGDSLLLQGYPFSVGGPHNSTIRWMSPLTIPRRHLFAALDALAEALERNQSALASGRTDQSPNKASRL
ncbi:MAG: aminotransferase class III-fold pyridoxal phosphate-dependent enzyme [Devosia sp.]|nr:aminotransferase class III-fold pyridoxal phosphate-dependent enzyme [Devosia sp.]